MYGHSTLTTEINPLPAYFPFAVPAVLDPLESRYNIALRTLIGAVGRTLGGLTEAEVMRWGLVPPWAKTIRTAGINARSETGATSSAFRHAFKTGHIVNPSDSWFGGGQRGRESSRTVWAAKGAIPWSSPALRVSGDRRTDRSGPWPFSRGRPPRSGTGCRRACCWSWTRPRPGAGSQMTRRCGRNDCQNHQGPRPLAVVRSPRIHRPAVHDSGLVAPIAAEAGRPARFAVGGFPRRAVRHRRAVRAEH